MHAALVRRFPDPVDSFEDDLAKKLGLERDPEMSIKDWRRVRVRFIDAATPR